MKARSVLLASGSASVVTLVLIGITLLLDTYLPRLLTLGFCLGLPIEVCAGGVFGAWLYHRFEGLVTVGQGALVGGLSGLFPVVLAIFVWGGWTIILVMWWVLAGGPLRELIELEYEFVQLMEQETNVGVVEVVSGAALFAGSLVFLGTVGGVIGGVIFRKPPMTTSVGEGKKAMVHAPADRTRRSGD